MDEDNILFRVRDLEFKLEALESLLLDHLTAHQAHVVDSEDYVWYQED